MYWVVEKRKFSQRRKKKLSQISQIFAEKKKEALADFADLRRE
jgi:hypothetical protein